MEIQTKNSVQSNRVFSFINESEDVLRIVEEILALFEY